MCFARSPQSARFISLKSVNCFIFEWKTKYIILINVRLHGTEIRMTVLYLPHTYFTCPTPTLPCPTPTLPCPTPTMIPTKIALFLTGTYRITTIYLSQYTSNKMQLYTIYLYLETALHVSGVTSTHHQERIQLYLQHLVFVTPLLLPAAIVEELELV